MSVHLMIITRKRRKWYFNIHGFQKGALELNHVEGDHFQDPEITRKVISAEFISSAHRVKIFFVSRPTLYGTVLYWMFLMTETEYLNILKPPCDFLVSPGLSLVFPRLCEYQFTARRSSSPTWQSLKFLRRA